MKNTLLTKEKILNQAMDHISCYGLESLSIGGLATKVKMSKSGIFSHFLSKENLQIQVLDYAAERFRVKVFLPAIAKPKGVPRIKAYVKKWLQWALRDLPGGCPFVAAAMEYDDHPGKIRDHLQRLLDLHHQSLVRLANTSVEVGHFKSDSDCEQFAFEFFSLLNGVHHATRMLGMSAAEGHVNSAVDALIQRFSV